VTTYVARRPAFTGGRRAFTGAPSQARLHRRAFTSPPSQARLHKPAFTGPPSQARLRRPHMGAPSQASHRSAFIGSTPATSPGASTPAKSRAGGYKIRIPANIKRKYGYIKIKYGYKIRKLRKHESMARPSRGPSSPPPPLTARLALTVRACLPGWYASSARLLADGPSASLLLIVRAYLPGWASPSGPIR
jgi:hypothetical protein